MPRLSQPEVPIAVLLREGFRWFVERMQVEAAQAGRGPLTTAQITVMASLRPADIADGIPISQLARRLGVSRQVAHVTVHELVDLEILELRVDPRSARTKLVRPTAEGEVRRQHAWQTLRELESEVADRIGPDLAQSMRRALAAAWPLD